MINLTSDSCTRKGLSVYGILTTAALLLLASAITVKADSPPAQADFDGEWVINEEMSDDTDRQVERAILAGGGRLPKVAKQGRERYRGGPEEHALYDHVSYDMTLQFDYSDPKFHFVYDKGFERIFYSDNRGRTVSASGTSKGDGQDFSFASWDNNRLIVESRVRDGGWIFETFTLEADGNQLRVVMELKPSSFAEPIRLTRIYDRKLEPDRQE